MDTGIEQQITDALGSLDEADADFLALVGVQQRLIATVDQIGTLTAELSAKIAASQVELMRATQSMQEAQMSFNLQYLQLQSRMQGESRQFTLLSNMMKTKHDTAKNSISNIR